MPSSRPRRPQAPPGRPSPPVPSSPLPAVPRSGPRPAPSALTEGGTCGGHTAPGRAERAHSRSMEPPATSGAPALGDLAQTSTGPTEGTVMRDSGETAAQEGQGEAGGAAGGTEEEAAGDVGSEGKGEAAENAGSEAKVEAAKDCGSEAKGEAAGDAGSEADVAGDAGSKLKGGALDNTGSKGKEEAAKDSGREAKGEAIEDAGSEAKEKAAKDSESEAKVEAAEDAGSEAKEGAAKDAGSEAKVEAAEDAGSEAKEGAAKDAGSEATGEAAKVSGSEAKAPGDAGSEAEVSGDAGKEPAAGQAAECEAKGQTRGSAVPQEEAEPGPRPVAAGNTQGQQEPTWLQDEDDELWPEFPPCSPTEGATSPTTPLSPTSPVSPTFPMSPTPPSSPVSPTSPTAGGTEGSGGSERGASAVGPRGRVPPRVAAVGRPRVSSRAQGRSAILEKFGGAATGPAPHLKRAGATGSVKAMLLEWCRARTRGYQHVDIQNFSGSWGNGLAFCALIHSFFPDAFDYGSLEPHDRQRNFTLAFTTAEERVDCAQLLEVEDMLRLAVPDAKCIYTYVQELYRSLVAKGLVKTKKR
ncbi:smoothelin-like protein 1 isoform X3 [Numida meleagris]|uniref:smoothelin-like protein 1 isoform X3 n=1 Tax=Numida meleagris TaxID=8996 RepID=UPI000B3E3197|nr:smoothelin-like protein 1 isoform X3 [Numida meleagris]